MKADYTLDAVLTIERSILGAAILGRAAETALMVGLLREEDFTGSLHRVVFRAIRTLTLQNYLPLDFTAVIAELQRAGVLQSFTNGWTLVSSLCEGVVLRRPMLSRCEQLKAMITARARRRALEKAAAEIS